MEVYVDVIVGTVFPAHKQNKKFLLIENLYPKKFMKKHAAWYLTPEFLHLKKDCSDSHDLSKLWKYRSFQLLIAF